MKILITGATGFIGRHLLNQLRNTNHKIFALVRDEKKISDIVEKSANLEVIKIDSSWKTKIDSTNPDVVIHFAAHLTSDDNENAIDKLIESNLLFGTHLLDALRKTQVKYFINTGTFAEYRNNDNISSPAYLYASTKHAFRYILDYYKSVINFKVINVIPYTIYGGIDTQKKVIDYIYEATNSILPVQMSPGEQVLDFIHIQDVLSFYLLLLDCLSAFKDEYTEMQLGTGVGTTPKQISILVEKITGKKPNIEWGGLPYRKNDIMYAIAKKPCHNISKWEPKIDINQGIRNYISVIQKNNNERI